MKKNLKRLRPLLLCLLCPLLLVDCSSEESVSITDSHDAVKTRILSLEELQAMPKVMEKLNSFTERKNKRLAYSSKYDFTLDTDNVLLVEKGKYQSLSFPISRSKDNGNVENLFLHPYKKGYIAFLARYKLTPAEIESLDNGKPIDNLMSKAQFTVLDGLDMGDLGVDIASTTGYTGTIILHEGKCWTINHVWEDDDGVVWFDIVLCPGCPCNTSPGGSGGSGSSGGSGPQISSQQYLAIADLGGGPGGPASGSGSTGGGSTGPGNPGNGYNPFNPPGPDQTDPNGSQDDEMYYPDPVIGLVSPHNPTPGEKNCEELARLSSDATFQAKMNDLKNKAATQNFESAYTLYQNATDGLVFSEEATGSATMPEVNLNLNQSQTQTPTNAIGFIHCHLDNGTTFKVFSFSDLYAYCDAANTSTLLREQMGLYVITESGTFALKINDKIRFKNWWLQMSLSQQAFEIAYNSYVKKTDSLDKQIKGLLKFMKNEFNGGLGLDLYQEDSDGGWEKLQLNNTNQNIVRTKC